MGLAPSFHDGRRGQRRGFEAHGCSGPGISETLNKSAQQQCVVEQHAGRPLGETLITWTCNSAVRFMCDGVAQLGRHQTAACRFTSIAVMGSPESAASITGTEARDSVIAAGHLWENGRALLIRLALDPRFVVKGQGCVLRALLITHGQKRLASVDRHGRAIASPVPELLLSRVPIYYFPLASHITPSQLCTPRNVPPPF